ncbi:MAG: alpha/beta fold hydrolase [Brevundimonas sp.]
MLKLIDRIHPGWSAHLVARGFSRPKRPRSLSDRLPNGTVAFNRACLAVYVDGGAADRSALLLHGWQGTQHDLDEIRRQLLARGWRTVAMDFPAHGRSPGRVMTLADMAAAVRGVVETYGPFDAAIAHSLGGAALVEAASGERVAARIALLGAPLSAGLHMRRLMERLGLPASRYPRIRTAYRALYGLDLDRFDVSRTPLSPEVPALLVYGSHDRTVPPDEGQRIHEVTPHGRLVVLEGVGHRGLLRHRAAIHEIIEFVR